MSGRNKDTQTFEKGLKHQMAGATNEMAGVMHRVVFAVGVLEDKSAQVSSEKLIC